MAGGIGSISFAIGNWEVPVIEAGMRPEVLSRPGSDGHDYRQIGRKPAAGVYRCLTTYTTAANRTTGKRAFTNLQASIALLTDGTGIVFSVFVWEVRHARELVAAVTSGATGNFHLWTELIVEVV